MWRKALQDYSQWQKIVLPLLLVIGLLIVGQPSLWRSGAQDPTADPTPETTPESPEPTEEPQPASPTPPDMRVLSCEPNFMTQAGGTLTVLGENFTATTIVRLRGFGVLETTFVNDRALTAFVPSGIQPGTYFITVSDPPRPDFESNCALNILFPTPSATTPAPTPEPPPTQAPATPVPGTPSLVVRNFVANPSEVAPGATVTLIFEIINQGNRSAQGISVTLDGGSSFVPASGQASATVGDIVPGGVASVSLSAVVGLDAEAGPNSVPITINYRDFSGESYSSKTTLSVNVSAVTETSQVILAQYTVDPKPVKPGLPVSVTVFVSNLGNRPAYQVLLRVSGTDSVLLAGQQGDTFAIGDLDPQETVSMTLPLIVNSAAKPGPQAQAVTFSYVHNGETLSSNMSMTIEVEPAVKLEPLMLIDSYGIGAKTVLRPGETFTLALDLSNVGTGTAEETLLTFGTVTGAPDDDGSGGSGTTTTPSTTFATIGTGGTVFLGTIESDGGGVSLTQDFIVNGSVKSGIYDLPVTLRYRRPDGSTALDNLRISLVVLAPPKLLVALPSPLPPTTNAGEPLMVTIDLTNVGADPLNVPEVAFATDNGDVIEGTSVLIGMIAKDKKLSANGVIIPAQEGAMTITVAIHFINDLSQADTLVNTYTVEVLPAPPPPEEPTGPPIDFTPTPEPQKEEEEQGTVERLLLGLLGLGS